MHCRIPQQEAEGIRSNALQDIVATHCRIPQQGTAGYRSKALQHCVARDCRIPQQCIVGYRSKVPYQDPVDTVAMHCRIPQQGTATADRRSLQPQPGPLALMTADKIKICNFYESLYFIFSCGPGLTKSKPLGLQELQLSEISAFDSHEASVIRFRWDK